MAYDMGHIIFFILCLHEQANSWTNDDYKKVQYVE